MSDGYLIPRSDEHASSHRDCYDVSRPLVTEEDPTGTGIMVPVMVTDVYPTVANQGLGLGFSILKV